MQEMQEIRVKGKAARIRGATWTHDQVLKLLEVWTQPDIYQGLLNEKKKQDIFKRIAATLEPLGVHRTWSECRAKMKNLKADFRRAMEKKVEFRYYSEMRKIMNVDGPPTATSIIAPGTSSSASGEYQFHRGDSKSEGDDGEGEDEGEVSSRYSPVSIERPGTSSSFGTDLPSRSPSEYINASPYHRDPPSSSPYQEHHYQTEEGDNEENRPSQPFSVSEMDHDSSSRSSMIITHVVSNVIEPVTTVIVPSSSGSRNREEVPEPVSIADQGYQTPISLHAHAHVEDMEERPPIRLEFVVDESENVVLQESTSSEGHEAEIHSSSLYEDQSLPEVITPEPPPPASPILKRRLLTQSTSAPVSPKRASQPQPQPKPHRSPPKQIPTTPHRPPPPKKSRKILFPDKSPQKKRKQLEILNKQTLETISNLLQESSQCLLKELQDSEQRFITWEEERRTEERRREEAMFSKLIGAMSKSPSTSSTTPGPGKVSQDHPDKKDDRDNDSGATNYVNDFTDMSRKLNGMLTDEVKATEESVRQWEVKMQRHESRHTEKLFAMIINAIKTPSEVS